MAKSDWPWQFREIDGVWHRRPANTNGPWSALTVTRVGTPPENRRSRGTDNKQAPSINEWSWG